MPRSRFAPSEPMATSAAMPSTTDSENISNRRREARESRQAILRMKVIRNCPRNTRKTRKKSEHKAFVFDLRKMAEIDQKTDFQARGMKVILNLSTMFICQF